MLIFIVEDDEMVSGLLQRIIKEKHLGSVIGHAANGEDALDDLKYIAPDIILVDLLMPIMDGITFVEKAKELYPEIVFVMLSQMSSKNIIAQAYEKGISFYMQKPVNAVEVVNVLRNVGETVQMKKTFQQMQSLLSSNLIQNENPYSVAESSVNKTKSSTCNASIKNLKKILSQLGILGENGSQDIITFVDHLITNKKIDEKYSVRDICEEIADANGKTMEQRIRRTSLVGLTNLAHMGIEDYSGDIFNRYANGIYNYEQVRTEMNYVRGISSTRGKVSLKSFLNSLAYYSIKDQ